MEIAAASNVWFLIKALSIAFGLWAGVILWIGQRFISQQDRIADTQKDIETRVAVLEKVAGVNGKGKR